MNCGAANGRPAGLSGMEEMQVLNFVYKNITFDLTLFYYKLYTSFTGEVLYDDWYMVMFNVLLTSLPVIALEVFKQDVSSDVCLQSSSCPTYSYVPYPAAFHKEEEVADVVHLGAITYACIIWTVNYQIALVISHFTWTERLVIWDSIFFWYIFLLAYGALPSFYSNTAFQGAVPILWLITLLVAVVSLLSYFLLIAIQRMLYPMDDHVVQEMKYCKKDVRANQMWLREQHNSQKMTQTGFSARVDARIRKTRKSLISDNVKVRSDLGG
ncbi:hypothetical protein KPL71_005333 [Citrus sinensis]|uniref:Uncharacterized protein n=1 Tax=Citrus sinensis TaxID=2711 RepID=A0ACB8ND87_CITSI|nr:hypothetical protein KPL71_005333 [Citrus sinensis]